MVRYDVGSFRALLTLCTYSCTVHLHVHEHEHKNEHESEQKMNLKINMNMNNKIINKIWNIYASPWSWTSAEFPSSKIFIEVQQNFVEFLDTEFRIIPRNFGQFAN
jgi:hypothetical protein